MNSKQRAETCKHSTGRVGNTAVFMRRGNENIKVFVFYIRGATGRILFVEE